MAARRPVTGRADGVLKWKDAWLSLIHIFAFSYRTSVIFYEDYDIMQPEQRLLMQQGMEAFGGNAPTYRIALLDKPTIVWIFIL